MRTDVKLGVVISMVVVLAAGGYFLFRGKGEAPIPVAAAPTPANPNAGKTAPSKPATPAKPRQVITNKDGAAKPNPANSTPRDNRLAGKPADQPVGPASVSPNAPRPAQPQPGAEVTSLTPGGQPINEPKLEPKPSVPAGAVPTPERAAETPSTSSALPSVASAAMPPAPGPTESVPLATPLAASSQPRSVTNPPPSGPSSAKSDPAPADARTASTDTHKVQPGDTLATLAQTYYGSSKYARILAEANPQIGDQSRLAVGTIVKIPALPPDADSKVATAAPSKAGKTTAGGKRTYKVQAGDSFYRIAKDQLGNASRWKELYALNKNVVHGDPTQLQVGQTLVLPES